MQLSHIIAHIALATAIVASTASPTDAAWGWMTGSKGTNDVESNSVAEVLHVERHLGGSAEQNVPYQTRTVRYIRYTEEEKKKLAEERKKEKKRKEEEKKKMEREAQWAPRM